MINNEQNNKKTTESTKILQNYKLSDNIDEDILVDDNTKIDDKIIKDLVIEKLMDDLIKEKQDKENTVIFTVSLTKIEYELWEKQGGEKWLKKILLKQR